VSKSSAIPIDIDIDRTDKILRFVRNNPNCTKADVIRHMKGRSAVRITHSIITKLVKKGKINENKKHIQTHLLTINEDDEFNKFHKMLVDIETLVEDMRNFMMFKVDNTGPQRVPKNADVAQLSYLRMREHEAKFRDVLRHPKIGKLFVGLDGIENSYRQSIALIILELYDEIRAHVDFEPYEPILRSILSSIYLRLAISKRDNKTSNQLLALSAKNIEAGFKAYNNQVKIKTNLGERLIDMIENFRKEVLNRKRIYI
jgi:hypothetical protein